NKPPEIHHSDRGSQYIYKDYVNLLKNNGCKISMAKTAQDNAYAERINRTIKNDYIEHWKPKSFDQLKRMMKKAVNQYNLKRPKKNEYKKSMAKTDHENANAERINKTIKNDYIEHWKPKSIDQLKRMLKKAVNQYNAKRPHNSIGKLSPMEFEKKLLMKRSFHQQSITIFNNEINV